MNRFITGLVVIVIFLLTVRGATAPPPSYYEIAPAVQAVEPPMMTESPVSVESMEGATESVGKSGMSVVLMLMAILLFVSVGSAVIIYRLKVRS